MDAAAIKQKFVQQQPHILATRVHSQFEKFGDLFKESMPMLESLRIAKGYFKLQTTQFFVPLKGLIVQGLLDPKNDDQLPAEQLASITNLVLEKGIRECDKAFYVVQSLTEGEGALLATSMKQITIDLTGMQPLRLMNQLFTHRNELRSVTMTNISTESEGLTFFNKLPKMTALKELNLSFARLRDEDINRNMQGYCFEEGSCPLIESLNIQYQVVGKGVSIANESWMTFFSMFSGLKSLSLNSAVGTEQPDFWPRVLSAMPALKTLNLTQSAVDSMILSSLASRMIEPSCLITNLAFDYSTGKTQPSKKPVVRKAPSFEAIEAFLSQLTAANKSLKSLDVQMQIRQSIELTPGLLQALAAHTDLEHISFVGVLKVQTARQLEDLTNLLVGTLSQLPKLKNFVIEPAGDTKSRQSDEEVANKV